MEKSNGIGSKLMCKMIINAFPKGNGTRHIKATCTKPLEVLVDIKY